MALGRYVDAGGVHTYYEEYGQGKPLVMLHGDGFTIENFSAQVSPLSQKYRLIIPERRGHGRTPDSGGEFSYETHAQETIAFMDKLGLQKAHLLGNSGGADIALFVTIQRPDLVDKLVVVSGESKNKPSAEDKNRILSAEADAFRKGAAVVVESFERFTPDGRNRFPAFFEKLKRLWATDWELTRDQLQSTKSPILVMVADHDFGSIEDAAELFRSIPGAKLCVVPGANHGMMFARPSLVNDVIMDFLAQS